MPIERGQPHPECSLAGHLARALLTASIALAGSLTHGRAEAQEKVVARLDWLRAPGGSSCIDGPTLRQAVEQRYARTIFRSDATVDIVVVGKIGPAPRGSRDRWLATLSLSTPDGAPLGTRKLTTGAKECSALDDSLALALGLMLDMSQTEVSEAREPRVEPVATDRRAAARHQTPPIRIPDDTLAPRQPWHFEPSVALVAGAGLAPGFEWGGRAGLTLTPPRFWKIEVSGALFADAATSSGPGSSDLALWAVALAICPIGIDARVELDACIVQRAGSVQSTGKRFDRNHVERNSILTFGLGARLGIPVAGPLVFRLGLNVEAPLLRYRFVYLDELGQTRQLFRVWPVTLFGHAGLGLRF